MKLTARFDEGPCFQFDPLTVKKLTDEEVDLYCQTLDALRDEYQRQLRVAAKQ